LWADEARFTQNESILLMLNDQRANMGVFYMVFGDVGKHPISDKDAVIKELKAQGKWQDKNKSKFYQITPKLKMALRKTQVIIIQRL
jgi:hypothetical protein